MNIKDNKGITLVTLVITVVILAIIAYASVSIGVNLINTGKFTNVETYMMLIKSSCETRLNAVEIGDMEESELYGEKQTEGDFENFYKLTQADLNDMGVKDAKAKDGYYVNYDDPNGIEVIYERGVENSGEIYYKLSDMINSGN